MRATRTAFAPTPAAKAYALDLEFVKFNNTVYARSAAFVPFRRAATTPTVTTPEVTEPIHEKTDTVVAAANTARNRPLPRLTALLERPVVLELDPGVALQLAEPLPCGHLLRAAIDGRFAPTSALTAVLAQFQAAAEDELGTYRDLRRAMRSLRGGEKRDVKAAAEKADDALDGAESEAVTDDDVTASADGEETTTATTTSSSAPSASEVTLSVESMVTRSLQIRAGIVRNFRGLDPYGIPNVRVFNKNALELLHAAPVESKDFKLASQHIRPLRAIGHGKNGYKGLAFCTRMHPAFIQKVLQTVFESPAAWYAWLTACTDRVAEDLQQVRDAHRAGMNSHGGSLTAVEFHECSSLEELGSRMSAVWSGLLHEGTTTTTTAAAAVHAPPKVFVYGHADRAVIHRTLLLQRTPIPPPLLQHLSERACLTGHFRTQWQAAVDIPSSSGAAVTHADEEGSRPDFTVSPFEARVVDLTKHPLFTASGFAASPKKTPSLTVALAKAATRDATAAALHSQPFQHDPLWDAQALACLCATAGAVR